MAEMQMQENKPNVLDRSIYQISVRQSNRFHIWKIKQHLQVQETIQLHGLGDAQENVVQISGALNRLGYVEIQKIETTTIDLITSDQITVKRAKLIVILKKSKDFDRIFEEYEKNARLVDLLAPKQE